MGDKSEASWNTLIPTPNWNDLKGLFFEVEPEAKKKGKNGEFIDNAGKLYPTEGHALQDRFVVDVGRPFVRKFPLTSVIAVLALGFFGLMAVFTFSPTSILMGAFDLTLSVCLGKAIWREGLLIVSQRASEAAMKAIRYTKLKEGLNREEKVSKKDTKEIPSEIEYDAEEIEDED